MHLLTKGLVSSRQQAHQLIRAGKVRDLNGLLLDKPGQLVPIDLELKIQDFPRFVSRGGEKLIKALKDFDISVDGRVCIDFGISTGGFTDCLLQFGASRVYGIDVGYGQTAWKLRQDSRVVLLERTNVRKLTPELLYIPGNSLPSLAVADLSFISLRLVMESIKKLLKEDADVLFLVKPQFEVGKELVGKGGVVKSESAHVFALQSVIDHAKKFKWETKGLTASPITGPAGNHEYLLWLGNKAEGFAIPSLSDFVAETLS